MIVDLPRRLLRRFQGLNSLTPRNLWMATAIDWGVFGIGVAFVINGPRRLLGADFTRWIGVAISRELAEFLEAIDRGVMVAISLGLFFTFIAGIILPIASMVVTLHHSFRPPDDELVESR